MCGGRCCACQLLRVRNSVCCVGEELRNNKHGACFD